MLHMMHKTPNNLCSLTVQLPNTQNCISLAETNSKQPVSYGFEGNRLNWAYMGTRRLICGKIYKECLESLPMRINNSKKMHEKYLTI